MRNLTTLKGKPTIYGILLIIGGFLHLFVPVWGIVIPEPINYAAFFWYWGFYFQSSSGNIDTGIIGNEQWLFAGRTAMTLMIICFVILLITLVLARAFKIFETEKNITIFGIVWLITGILMLIAPSIYVIELNDVIFDEDVWGIGIYMSYGFAIIPLILGIILLYSKMKGEKIGT